MTKNTKEDEAKKGKKSSGTGKKTQSTARKKTQTAKETAKTAESASTEKTQGEKAEECKEFFRVPKIDLSKFDVGFLLAGVNSIRKGMRKFDSKASVLSKDLYDRMAKYFDKTVDAYKSKK